MKRIFFLAIIIFTLSGCNVFQDNNIYDPIDAKVKTDCELKSKIKNGKTKVTLKKGDPVKILARTHGKYSSNAGKQLWLKIETKSDETGWMPFPCIDPAYKKNESFKKIARIGQLQTALNESIYKKNMKNVLYIIKRGAEPEYKNPSEYSNLKTPLEQAVNVEYDKGVDFLLKYSDKQTINKAFFLSVMGKNMEGMKKLLKNGADVNWKNSKSGRTPLLQVSGIAYTRYPYFKIMQFLINNGAKINEKDKKGNTALMYNILGERIKAVVYLLEKGARTDSINKQGQSVMDFAKRTDNEELIKIIKTALKK